MAENYQKAAWRHQRVGELLVGQREHDDAGYHFGVAGENAVKHALQISGVEAKWIAAGVDLRETPMRKHFPKLKSFSQNVQAEIALYASGRLAGAIAALITSPTFAGRFAGWDINIRYAHASCTPVSAASSSAWENDSVELLLQLAI